jgi:hypothetical protein
LSADAGGNGKTERRIISRGNEMAIEADINGPKEGISRIGNKDVLLIKEAAERLKYSWELRFSIS